MCGLFISISLVLISSTNTHSIIYETMGIGIVGEKKTGKNKKSISDT